MAEHALAAMAYRAVAVGPVPEAPTRESREEFLLRIISAFLDEFGLSRVQKRFAFTFLQQKFVEKPRNMVRVRDWMLGSLNRSRGLPRGLSSWQRGCPDLIPGLEAKPFWDIHRLPWVATIEESVDTIRDEVFALRGRESFRPYRSPSSATDKAPDGIGSVGTDAGAWSVLYLHLHGMNFEENRSLCPKTCALIESIPHHYHHAFFSAMSAGSHIKRHHGPTNKKLRCQVPLVVPRGSCKLRVGEETRVLEEGKCIVFDDSFEHEAWNNAPNATRIILIFDVWHPGLSNEEIKFLGYLQNSALKRHRQISLEQKSVTKTPSGNPDSLAQSNDFFSVIHRANEVLRVSDDEVFHGT